MSNPAIAAVVCTYDRYELLPKAIESLTQQAMPADEFEILVVDNSPDARHSEMVADRYRSVKNLKWIVERRPGLSNARNVGADKAAAPIVAFMDDDAVATPNWLSSLLHAFRAFGPDAQAAGGRVVPIWGAERPSWLPDDLLGYVSVVDWGGNTRFAGAREWVAGTNVAFRSDALQDVGGFSVSLGRKMGSHSLLSNEEMDVIDRLGTSGGQLVYVPDAIVEHLVPPERLTQAWFRRRVVWQAVSDYLQNPKALFERAPNNWREVMDYFARLEPRYRTPRGLYVEHADPEMFSRQMGALYSFTIATLTGFQGLPEGVP